MSDKFDVVVVGGGHNGLVCGAYLARQGKSVCVLERKAQVGGATVTEELWPGFRISTASYLMALLQPKVIMDLELKRHGLEIIALTPTFQPLSGDRAFTFWSEPDRLRAEIARFSPHDAAAYPDYLAFMTGVALVVRDLLWQTPFDPGLDNLKDAWQLASFGWKNRAMLDKFHDVYDLMTLSAYDLLSRWFESDDVKAVLGFYAAAAGGNVSMKTPGSAYIMLRGFLRDNTTAAGGSGVVKGGMGSITRAILKDGAEHGLVAHCDAEVSEILISGGRATGVRLSDGRVFEGKTVVSNLPAKLLFQKLIPAGNLQDSFLKDVSRIRDRSTAYKVNLALKGLPTFRLFDPAKMGFAYPALVKVGPDIDYIERSFDGSKYGEYAQNPCMAVLTPSVLDTTLAPDGHHVMSIFGTHAPYRLATGDWTDADREALYERTIATLEQHAPNIRELILHKQILVPPDLERLFTLPGGHVHHGELSADQVFFKRPVKHYADYRTPIGGLFMCGASTHPGGGVTGVPGHNAARVVSDFLA
ncbi:phytoene desaturase family protein [Paraburkholderia sp. SIMBA_030]|uniref:phytoene desaturase family protein n=1 Tax=Paraburkholderia sp. SIMBA_030 TaxID=3085773 RepID=UPI00397CD8C1